MNKLLLITIAMLGLSPLLWAQKPITKIDSTKTKIAPVADSVKTPATIESLSQQISAFVEMQRKTNASLEKKINAANARLQNTQNVWPIRDILKGFVPILVLVIFGGFLVWIVYFVGKMSYRKTQLRYDTMLKCVESTGSVPEFFNKSETQRAAASVPIAGRVHLVLSVLCAITGTIFAICAIATNSGKITLLCGLVSIAFVAGAVALFIKFNHISENSRSREE